MIIAIIQINWGDTGLVDRDWFLAGDSSVGIIGFYWNVPGGAITGMPI